MRKKLVRMLSLTLCLLLAAGIFAGCSVQGGSGGGGGGAAKSGGSKLSGEINFWMQNYGNDPSKQQELLNKHTAKFKQDYGVTVNVTYVDWGQALTKYTLASSGGEAPDVADTFFAYSWNLIGGEKYGPMIIDDIAAELKVEDAIYSVAKPECFFNGHWYALPWRGDTRAAAYNQTYFDEAGITEFPKTYDELMEVAEKLTVRNGDTIERSGFIFSVGSARFDQTWFSVLAGFGGTVMNLGKFTEFTLNTDQNREALQFMQDSIHKYNIIPKEVIDPSYKSGDVYQAGKAAIVLGVTPDFLAACKNNAPQIAEVTKSAVMPSKKGSGTSSIAFAAPVCVFKTSKNPEAAKAWLKYFCSKEMQLEAMQVLSLVNAWVEVMNDDYFKKDPWFSNFTIQTGLANPGDMPIPEFSQIDDFPTGPLNTMCTEVMAGMDVQGAIDKCLAGIDKIMAESKK